MKDITRSNQLQNPARSPKDWLQRRYQLPDATARLIAEMVFASRSSRAADVERGAR